MIKNCLYCGKPVESRRSTKKYCSDACKQLAFYKRTALTGSDNSERPVKQEQAMDEKPFNDMLPSNHSDWEEQLTVNRPAQTLNDNRTVTINEPSTVKQEELPYDWVHSKLIDAIANKLDEDYETLYMFEDADTRWGAYTLTTVKWVSVRLRCLVENLLWLNNCSKTSYDTIVTVKEAFNAMINSRHYKTLPANYPFATLIKKLHERVATVAKEHERRKSIRFRLTVNRKVELIVTRFMLADFVPRVKFFELNFSE